MSRPLKFLAGLFALVVLLVAARYGYQTLMLDEGRTPEGYEVLTAIPAESFEPKVLPQIPVLKNQSTSDLAIVFGYKVGTTPYSYALTLSFPAGSDAGHATMTVQHATREASVETSAVRRWDEPRKAYAVALQDKFDVQPAVPSLCIKVVIGPQTKSYDLSNGSLCVAQRDGTGTCHPETLACGLIR